MAQRTHGELIQDLRKDVTFLHAALDAAQTELERADLLRVRERLAVVEERVGELKRMKEETDRRYWQFATIGIGAVLTMLANIIVNLILIAAKK